MVQQKMAYTNTTRNLILYNHSICNYMWLSIICNYVLYFYNQQPFKNNSYYFSNYGVITKLYILPYWLKSWIFIQE